MPKCKGCGALIEWLEMKSGKSMPVDVNRINVAIKVPQMEGPTKYEMIWGFQPHWATCPNAKDFKK